MVQIALFHEAGFDVSVDRDDYTTSYLMTVADTYGHGFSVRFADEILTSLGQTWRQIAREQIAKHRERLSWPVGWEVEPWPDTREDDDL